MVVGLRGIFTRTGRQGLFVAIENAHDPVASHALFWQELTPEFFYLPDFLENRSRFDLGSTQAGERIDSVVLPRWAHGSPREFVRLHRQALESDFVSSNLHNWIDLVFG